MEPAQCPTPRGSTVTPPGHPQGYQDCFDAFVADTYAAIRGESPEGLPTFADGTRAAVITGAVLDSAALGYMGRRRRPVTGRRLRRPGDQVITNARAHGLP